MECPICFEDIIDEYICSHCGKIHCKKCYINIIQHNIHYKCPFCRNILKASPNIEDFPIMVQNRSCVPDCIQGSCLICCSIGCITWSIIWCVNFIGV